MLKSTIFTAFTLHVMLLCSQSNLDTIQAPYKNLNKNNIPSGILWDRAFCISYIHPDPYEFQGTINSSIGNNSLFEEFVNLANMAAFDDSIAMRPDTFYSRKDVLIGNFLDNQIPTDPPQVILSCMHYQYERIDSNALLNGKIGYDTSSQKYFDIPGQDPYNHLNLVVGGAVYNLIRPLSVIRSNPNSLTYSVNFELPSKLFLTNISNQTPTIEADFNDGNGFVPYGLDQNKRVEYSHQIQNLSEGLAFDEVIKIKLTYHGAVTYYAKIRLIVHIGTEDPVILSNRDLTFNQHRCEVELSDGIYEAEARVYVQYGNEGGRNDEIIDKPVIFIEGFDSGLEPYGNQSWAGFSTGFFVTESSNDLLPQLRLLPVLVDSLQEKGYDVLIVDFKSGVDDIRNNAAFVIRLIQWVNEKCLEVGSQEQLVVAGASMGGLIARHALLKLEEANCCHNTRFYATLDSPHRGANIPVGLQLFIRNLGYKVSLESARKQYEKVLRSPAAMQLLQYHVNSTHPTAGSIVYNPWANTKGSIANNIHRNFFDELNRMGGQPKSCFNYALVNGSITGKPGDVSPGEMIIDMALDLGAPRRFPSVIEDWHYLGTKVYGTSSNSANHILETKGIFSSPLSYTYYTIDWTVYWLGLAASVLTGGNTDADFEFFLSRYFWLNDQLNYSVAQGQINRRLDGCPGSSTNTIELVVDDINNSAGLPLARALEANHTFVPTYSALDLNITNPQRALKSDLQLKTISTPFNNFWSFKTGGPNENYPNDLHVRIRSELISDFINEIEETRNPLTVNNSNYIYKNLSSRFNYGHFKLFLIQQIDIDAFGKLLINNSSYPLHHNEITFPNPGSSFKVRTHGSSCSDSWIRIKDGGLLMLGDNLNSSFPTIGDLTISRNTFLEIKSGGTLRVSNGSTLKIEEGAELIIHPGAIIELNGDSAVLQIEGKLILKENAVFQTTGPGFVRIDHRSSWTGNRAFVFESNTQIDLSRSDTSQKVLEILGHVGIPQSLALLRIDSAKVEMGQDAILAVHGKLSCKGSKFDDLNSETYRSLRVFGQEHVQLDSCFFYGGKKQLEALLMYYGNKLAIKKCKFFDPQDCGVYVEGVGVQIEDCLFEGGSKGTYVLNATTASAIKSCYFKDQVDRGILFKGQSAVSLNIEECEVKNAQVGISVEDVNLRMSCTRSTNNSITGLEALHSYLNLGNEARNTLTDNPKGIDIFQGMDLKMRDGQNHIFNNSSSSIWATFDNNHVLGSALSIDMFRNNIDRNGSNLNVFMHVGGQMVGVHNYANSNSFQTWSCYAQPSPYPDMVLQYPSFRVINNSDFTNTYYSDAFYSAISDVSYDGIINADLSAVSKLSNLLNLDISNPSANEVALQEYGFRMMMTALSNAYEQDLVPLNRAVENNPENQYLSMVIEQINDQLVANTGVNPELVYELTMSKAHMFRMAEHYDYAQQTLGNTQAVTYEELVETSYWQCVCAAEEALLHQELTADEYLAQKAYCQAQLQAKRSNQTAFSQSKTTKASFAYDIELIERLSPNPASDYVEVSLSQCPNDASIVLIDQQGNRVITKGLRSGENTFRLDLQSLANGAYTLAIVDSQGNWLDTRKLIVQ